MPAPHISELHLSAHDAEHHLDAVAQCRRRIAAGEIFQANLCLRLHGETGARATDLFAAALEHVDPPYGAAFATPRGGIASLSPELFLRRRGRHIVTGPIKGTIARDPDPVIAAAALDTLRGSVKDAAEHVMIVDLMRNDLGRVCEYGTVVAPRRPTAEPHPGLWHLVSHVHGRLRPEVTDADVLRATFPPGSVTGAPKVQSLRVIAELEGAGREVYTGAVGFASPAAGLELNVAIRTLEVADGHVWLGAGGGIVADSDPPTELEEALTKARPIAAAVAHDRGRRATRAGHPCSLTAPRACSRRCSSVAGASTPSSAISTASPIRSACCTGGACPQASATGWARKPPAWPASTACASTSSPARRSRSAPGRWRPGTGRR